MVDDQPLIEARDMGVYRSNRWLVRHVDVKVLRGQLVYIIGANGAGKSTTAKALLGLITFDEGEIKRLPGLKVGYVPQRLQINPTLPLTMRRLLRLTKRYAQADIDHALTAVGLQRLGNPFVSTLSGGEFQRLLLAQALLARPDLLLLDEPAQGVDAAGADKLHNVIDGIRNELGCGVLCISHDLQLAMDTGDDFLVLVPHEHDVIDIA
ncbi:MAG: ATP-binding cassette domain-containing protein [Gammaproteobacteria bacterium]|nr:ATP-binding cassette domain-containing protein [Gammaproteobacteria bacterium]